MGLAIKEVLSRLLFIRFNSDLFFFLLFSSFAKNCLPCLSFGCSKFFVFSYWVARYWLLIWFLSLLIVLIAFSFCSISSIFLFLNFFRYFLRPSFCSSFLSLILLCLLLTELIYALFAWLVHFIIYIKMLIILIK